MSALAISSIMALSQFLARFMGTSALNVVNNLRDKKEINAQTILDSINPANSIDAFGSFLGLNNLKNNLGAKYLDTGLSDKDIAANEATLDMRRRGYAADVQGMQEAGLNPAMMYEGSGSASSPSSAVSAGGSLSDIVSLLMLPSQIKQIEATTKNIGADTALKATQSNINVQEERIRKIAADFGIEMTQAQIDSLRADIAAKDADIDLKRSQTDLVQSQTDAQNIANEYLPDKYFSEIAKLDADAALARANEAMQRIQYEYARENGVLMSSNDYITLATYLVDLFGLSKGDAKSKTQKVVQLVNSANSWIDNKIQSASDWFDDKVVNRIRSRFKNSK